MNNSQSTLKLKKKIQKSTYKNQKQENKYIGIVNLSLDKNLKINLIKELIESYTNLSVQILQLPICLYWENNQQQYYIYDLISQQEEQLIKNEQDIIDVVSISNTLQKYKTNNIKSYLIIIDQDIYDPYQKEKNIVGRACGNQTCVVQYSKEKDEFYTTVIHELLHTIGFGHCLNENCIMFKYVNTTLGLCQKELKQLQQICQFNQQNREKKLISISQKIGLSKSILENINY